MGTFSRITSQGLSAPPYVLCFLTIITLCWLSDKFRMRGPFCALAATVAGVGFIINATTTTTAPRYFSIFLSVEIFASVALLLAWVANIHATESKRAGGYTVLATVGQCGPLLGESFCSPLDEDLERGLMIDARHECFPRGRGAALPQGHVDLGGDVSHGGGAERGAVLLADLREQEDGPRGCAGGGGI